MLSSEPMHGGWHMSPPVLPHATSLFMVPKAIPHATRPIIRLLQDLDLSHNVISSLPPSLWTVVSLRSLLLGHNCLASIKQDILHLTQLQVNSNFLFREGPSGGINVDCNGRNGAVWLCQKRDGELIRRLSPCILNSSTPPKNAHADS